MIGRVSLIFCLVINFFLCVWILNLVRICENPCLFGYTACVDRGAARVCQELQSPPTNAGSSVRHETPSATEDTVFQISGNLTIVTSNFFCITY